MCKAMYNLSIKYTEVLIINICGNRASASIAFDLCKFLGFSCLLVFQLTTCFKDRSHFYFNLYMTINFNYLLCHLRHHPCLLRHIWVTIDYVVFVVEVDWDDDPHANCFKCRSKTHSCAEFCKLMGPHSSLAWKTWLKGVFLKHPSTPASATAGQNVGGGGGG